jgi:hypothetical protein
MTSQNKAVFIVTFVKILKLTRYVGFVVDRETLQLFSSEYFGFPCKSFTPLIAPQSSPSIIQSWYTRPINGHSNNGRGSTPGQYKKDDSTLSWVTFM